MPREPTARHLVAALPALLLAISAYLVANGIAALADTAMLGPLDPPPRPARTTPAEAGSVRSAEAILERNPFDSVTGPLTATPLLSVLPPPPPAPPFDPLHAPRCPDAFDLSVTSEDADPEHSVAMLQGPGEKHGHARRVGDAVGEFRVEYIGHNPVEGSPAVWLTGTDGVCQTLLFEDEPRSSARTAKAPTPKSRASTPRPGKPARRHHGVPVALRATIQQTEPGRYTVPRASVDQFMSHFAAWSHRLRIRPKIEGGNVVGFSLLGVHTGTLLKLLGLRSGDVVSSINGFQLTGPQSALDVYARLRVASDIRVSGTRNGKPLELEYRIR